MSEQLSASLYALLGEDGLVSLAEAFGGTRLYVPLEIGPTHAIAKAVGSVGASRLVKRFSPSYIKVPLVRELRARHYREKLGLTNAAIALKLGMAETGVEKMFARMDSPPVKGGAQLSLGL